jgi:hypothetical protein
LPVPRRDPDEVGLLGADPVDREQEARHLPVLRELAQLDVGGEISDQRDAVHSSSFVRCRRRR